MLEQACDLETVQADTSYCLNLGMSEQGHSSSPIPIDLVKSRAAIERACKLHPRYCVFLAEMLAKGEGYRGSWLIKGDALLSCDVSQAKIVRVDTTARTATLRLPPLHVTSARVDHEKTRTWSVERNTWLPWKWGEGAVANWW